IISLSKLLTYYKRPDIQNAIIQHVGNKEIAVRFGERGFGKRPDILQYPSDIIELAKQGATSFHASEELWKNPQRLGPEMKKNEVDDLRIGWDLVIDVDCKFLEYSKVAADFIVKALMHYGVNAVSVKFSGNHGFHIAVPFESFPKKIHNIETRFLFPDAPRNIALYLEEITKPHIAKAMLMREDIDQIIKKTGKKFEEIVVNGKFDPFKIIDIDTLLISTRHLYRMPYCFNEKSGLISIPINPEKILEFKIEDAKPENVKVSNFVFIDRSKAVYGEAEKLIIQAFDFCSKKEKEEIKKEIKSKITGQKNIEELQKAVPEELFPPCIKIGLNGLEDGRKRFLFALLNFLVSVGWDYDRIEGLVNEWNKRNRVQLKETIVVGQLRYHKQNKNKVLPPNCDNQMYYKGMGICKPDHLCEKIKNPVNYSKRKAYFMSKEEKKKRGGKRKEEK
ncbi:MAG: hypothetical protein N3D84_01805, partial [Candidatus Woesearchaeota archaeon]|nr:hypothetical protein [Candidatus Woesearchaeota archaeon]